MPRPNPCVLMMTTALLCGVAGGILIAQEAPANRPQRTTAGTLATGEPATPDIHSYRTWIRVNPRAVRMEPAPATQCAAPQPSQLPSPHLQKYLFVYVNPTAKVAMLRQKSPRFPIGSVIVKEKLARPDIKMPELLTVMVKREKGYNPKSGDWEYMVYDGTGTKVTARGKMDSCQFCHNQFGARESDHVFRYEYLTTGQYSALK